MWSWHINKPVEKTHLLPQKKTNLSHEQKENEFSYSIATSKESFSVSNHHQ
jgi:hypothetical protein